MTFDAINAFEMKTSSESLLTCGVLTFRLKGVLLFKVPPGVCMRWDCRSCQLSYSPATPFCPPPFPYPPYQGGSGNVVISRDLWRLATRLDLFRCLHFFYSSCG